MNLFSLEGKISFVTGAGSGIGQRLARDFAVNGAFSLPKSIQWSNFSESWETGVKDSFWNSVFVTSVKVPVGIVLESMAAFALTHMHFKWANRVFTHILIGLIVPMQMTLVPLTLLMNALNLNAEMIYLHTDRNRPIRVYHAVDQRFILEDFFAKLAWWYRKTP